MVVKVQLMRQLFILAAALLLYLEDVFARAEEAAVVRVRCSKALLEHLVDEDRAVDPFRSEDESQHAKGEEGE